VKFKIIKYDFEARELNPELYQMAKDNICYDEFMKPKKRYIEKLKR